MKDILMTNMDRRWTKAMAVMVLAVTAMMSCKQKSNETPASAVIAPRQEQVVFTDAQARNAGIETGVAERRDIDAVINVNGVVDVPPQNLISISAMMGGYLKDTKLLPGMHINKGQHIAEMEDQGYVQLQQDYCVSVARLEMLKKDYERQQALNASKTSSDKTFEASNAEYQSQKVIVRALAEKLRLINIDPEKLTASNISRSVHIVSPINGYVSAVNVNIGAYVNPSHVMFELVNPADLHLALNVFERDLPYLRIGQSVRAHVSTEPQKSLSAEVILVGKKLNENRAAVVHCHFNGNTTDILPGMYVNADIQLTKPGVLAVPDEAVVRLADKEYVFVQTEKNRFRRVEVTSGSTSDHWTEVTSKGENIEGKTIITKHAWSALMLMENKAE